MESRAQGGNPASESPQSFPGNVQIVKPSHISGRRVPVAATVVRHSPVKAAGCRCERVGVAASQ